MRAGPRRTGERRITASFGLAAVAAAGFGAVYATGGNVQLEGVTLFVAFSGLAYGLAAWAQHRLPQGPFVEEREPMRSPPQARSALTSELDRDEPIAAATLPRRALALAAGTLGAVLLFPLRSLFRGPEPVEALDSTPWQAGAAVVDKDGTLIRPENIPAGTMITVFPQGEARREIGDSAVALIRADPAELDLDGERMGWTVEGIVAYSLICTHAGCPVGQYVATTGTLMCPCHQSLFDAWGGATPMAGPAARPLPQLPLGVDEAGFLVARGPFREPIGPGYWSRP